MPYRDPDQQKARNRRYYLEKREEIIATVKKYAGENKEKIRASRHKRYLESKDDISRLAKEKRIANPEQARAKDRASYARNAEKRRERDRLRYAKEQEQRKNNETKYRKQNPDKRADAQQRRRALKAGAEVERVLRAEILLRDGPLCAICEVETVQPVHLKSSPNDRHYDHIIPLFRGGSHSMGNMRILCAKCNMSKKSRLDSELPESFAIERRQKNAA